MPSRIRICFHTVKCCCSHFPGAVWISAYMWESHVLWGSAWASLLCDWTFKFLWIILISLLLPLGQPVAWTAQPTVAEGEVRSSHQTAVQLWWMTLVAPVLLPPPLGWAKICLDLRFPLGGEKVNTFCKSHSKAQSKLNNQDTGIYFIVKSNGTGLRKEKYRLSVGKKRRLRC